MGSRVIRGANLRVTPDREIVLYVRRSLRGSNGHLSRLKTCIAATVKHVVIEGDVTEALSAH